MRCPSCGQENREGRLYCAECGSGLGQTCASCGTQNEPGEKFCGKCGSALTEVAPPTRTPTPAPAPAIPASFASGRYQVQRFLGEGGKKRVYLAHDARLDRDVAIALIKTEGLSEEGVARIRREGQAMGQLGDHPHIVTAYDIGDEAGRPYIVSQYMAGGDLEELLRGADGRRLPLEDVLRIGEEVCRALEHAHERGIIHRDLKPGNIWLTEDRTAKLGDFGFALALDRSRLTQAGMMVGTPYCMPPEQALGGEVTAASDLYSLGCVLYEMVAGRPPFPGDDPTAVISQHINTAPVAPSWYTEHCPPGLEELILRLMAKAPDDRPQSAAEVLEALGRVDPKEKSVSHTEANVLDRLARGVFVGREKELDGLRKAFDEAFAGRGGIVMLVGEPGIGKTRTAQELETHARMRGAQVLWGPNHESEGAPAYWPWYRVGNAYAAAQGLADIGPLPDGAVGELSRIFPVLRQGDNFVEPGPVTDPEAAQFRLFDAYTAFVQAMSNQKPLLIALDDLHWTDKASLLLLQHLARELSRMRVLVVGTYRDTDLVRTHPLSEALATLNRESGFQRIVLRGLTREEVASYIRGAANVQPAPSVLEKIFEETEGNPFFLSEVVNLMAQEGTLTKESVSDIAIPDGVREALGRRLNRISEEANELLQIAAVVGSEFTYDTLTLLDDRGEDELLGLIEEALEARVIEEQDRPGRYRFTHAQMHDTLLAELSTTRRVRLHGRIGEALEQRWGAQADERATRLAQHFVEAAMLTPRHAEKAVRYSKLAAAQAEGQTAWDVAARHYEHCLTLVSEAEDSLGEDEAAMLTALGTCARNAGEYRPSWRSLMRARTLYQQRGDGDAFARATLEALLVPAPPDRYVALAREALEALRDGDPHLRARLLQRVGRLDEAAELAREHGYEDVQAQLFLTDATAVEGEKPDEAARLRRRAYELFTRLGFVREAADALYQGASALLRSGRLDEGETAAEETLGYAREHHLRYFEDNASAFLASVLLVRCDFPGFDRLVQERAGDATWVTPLLSAARAEMAGDLVGAVARLPDPAMAGGVPLEVSAVCAARARILRNAGHEREAGQEYSRMREALQATPGALVFDGVAIHVFTLDNLDEALPLLADDSFMSAAARCVRHYCEEVPRAPVFNLVPARCLSRIAAATYLAEARVDEAEQHFRTGLEWCERERCPVEAGRCLQGLAEVAERRDDTAEALQLLDRAGELFQQHGAKLYLERVIAKKVQLQGIASGDVRTSIDSVAAIVESEQPDLRPHAAPDGTVTMLFTDIEDSVAITERLGDQRWMELLREHNAIVREQVQAHQGHEVKSWGDAFMVVFGSARSALQCAIEIQRAVARHNESAEEPIRARIGLHTGEPMREEEDFFGKHVNLTSRIANEAEGAEILVSSLLRELTESAGDIRFDKGREVELKGLSGRQRVFEVAWE